MMYPSTAMHEDVVAEARAKSFEWIFQNTDFHANDNFMSWLRDSNEICWSNRKAASGKSTLMKFLCNDPRVETALQR